MDRRQFLTLSAARQKRTVNNVSFGRTDTGVNTYTGPFETAQMVHVLKRALFGATPADLAWAKSLGNMDAVVDALLTMEPTPPAPPVNNYGDDSTGIAPGQTWIMSAPYVKTDGDSLGQNRQRSYRAWWMGVLLNQKRSIQEKMTLFWHNHFPTETTVVLDLRYHYQYNATLRQHCIGNFKQLVKAVTLDPCMLVYLNGDLNSKTAAQENYARELQELFTIGKGPDSHYTEDDVRAASRVLTGYRINAQTVTSYFDSSEHDFTNKQFSDFYGKRTVTGQTGAAGAEELDALLDLIFSNAEVAKFIVRKLYRYFVYYDIDSTVEENVITPLANIFRDNDYELVPLLKAMFKSEHFYDPLNMSCLIKSPADFCVGLCREFSVEFPPASDYMNAYDAWDYLRDTAGKMQQNLGDPPNVAGWPAYYQEPMFHELWITTDTLPKRNQLSDFLITGQGARNNLKADVLAFADQLSDPGNPNTLIQDSLDLLYRVEVPDAFKTSLKSNFLLSGQTQDYYWTQAWQNYKNNPTDMTLKEVVETRLKNMYKFIMDLSEYQLS